MVAIPFYPVMGSFSFSFNHVLRHVVNKPVIENMMDQVKSN